MSRIWNETGVILAILSLSVALLWTFEVIEYERAVIALLVMIVFGLIYIGTECMGAVEELRHLNERKKK